MSRWAASFLVVGVLVGCGSRASTSGTVGNSTTTAPAATTPPPSPGPATPPPASTSPSTPFQLTGTTASEFAGGWGIPPAPIPGFPPPVPPPPTLTVTATFSNTFPKDYDKSDPQLALLVSFSDTATGTLATQVVPLTASLPAFGSAQEVVTFTLKQTYSQVWVTAAIVRVDVVTGQVAGYLSQLLPPVLLKPPIYYPV